MNAMCQEYLKFLPRFTGEDELTKEQHLPLFCTFAENLNVEHLDVVMGIFVQHAPGTLIEEWLQLFLKIVDSAALRQQLKCTLEGAL